MANQINIGINGCGRIGRKVLRLAFAPKAQELGLRVVAVNDTGDLNTLAHMMKYDSVHGTWDADIHVEGKNLVINGQKVWVHSDRDPSKLEWKKDGVQIVHECTGAFTDKEKASLHLQGGAQKVLISAPSKDADITLCYGVNHTSFDAAKHTILSNASCTTNCLAPLVKVVDENFGVVKGTMLTVHSYTNDQRILDLPHKDLRRARAAALNMIPTSTGAAKAVGLVLPHLKGKIDGLSIRVPTPNVSLIDFSAEISKKTTKEELNAVLKKAAETTLKGILNYTTVPLVSHDYNGNLFSSIIDSECTMVIEGNFVKVISWYDNESGFSQRMLDMTAYIAGKL